MTDTNLGRSIEFQNSYLNRAFLIVEHTTIRPDWVAIRSLLNFAFNRATQDPSIPFYTWLEEVFNNIGTNVRFLNSSQSVSEISIQSEQVELAKNIITWLSGNLNSPEMLEGYPYEKTIKNLTSLRQKNGEFSPKNLAHLRNDYDSHQYWYHYIKYFENIPEKVIRPPKPGSHKPGVNRGALELIHELDGLLNIILTIMPKFEFVFLMSNVKEESLDEMFNNLSIEPKNFAEFKTWIFQNELLSKRIEKSFQQGDRFRIYSQAAMLWLGTNWVKEVCQCNWFDALKLVYQGKLEDLFYSLIESCKKGQSIQLHLKKLGVIQSEEFQHILDKASQNTSAYVEANYVIIEQEAANAGNSRSEYEKYFSQIVNIEVLNRSELTLDAIKRAKARLVKEEENSKQARKLYTRVGKSRSISKRVLPFIFFFCDMKARYHHWFVDQQEKDRATNQMNEKIEYSSAESGQKTSSTLEILTQDYPIVNKVKELLFSFSSDKRMLANYKNNLACIFAFHSYEHYLLSINCSAEIIEGVKLICELAIDTYANDHELPVADITLNDVDIALKTLEKEYPLQGFSSLKNDVFTRLNKIPALFDEIHKLQDLK